MTSARQIRLRSTLVWFAVTALAAAVGALAADTAHDLATAPATDFTGLLVQACAVVALGAAGCLWLLAGQVAVLAWRGADAVRRARLGPVRGFLLTLCGVAVLSGTTPAHAAAPHSSGEGSGAPAASALAGLPLPDRATGALVPDRPDRPDRPGAVVVRTGDALWTIAVRQLGRSASSSEVAAYTARLHVTNRSVIGPDPDLIQPGQRLLLPPA